jgi:hypothetical protein
MGIQLDEKIITLINDPLSIKALASTNKNGEIHLVFKGSLSVTPEGNIQFFELNETSQNNKNLAYSLWFKRPVFINILGQNHSSYQIRGIPTKAIITGREFEKAYISVRQHFGEDADLSTVWIMEPVALREETFSVRKQEEREQHPLVGHLDRFVQR